VRNFTIYLQIALMLCFILIQCVIFLFLKLLIELFLSLKFTFFGHKVPVNIGPGLL
jgi:hypothetical protein